MYTVFGTTSIATMTKRLPASTLVDRRVLSLLRGRIIKAEQEEQHAIALTIHLEVGSVAHIKAKASLSACTMALHTASTDYCEAVYRQSGTPSPM